jgi:hypothetical protein
MSDFDDFLQKKSEKMEKEAKKTEDDVTAKVHQEFQEWESIEWPKLFPAIEALLRDAPFDEQNFITRDNKIVSLGNMAIVLGRLYKHGIPPAPHGVEYKKTSSPHAPAISTVELKPVPSATGPMWSASGLGSHPFSTPDLAKALLEKLVEAYLDHKE